MYFDALTTAAVADELRDKCRGGRIQRIVQVDPLSLGLEIFADGVRHQVLASADPRYPRLYLADYKLRRGVESPTPLLLLARKHLEGARLIQVEQPPFERVLKLLFSGPEEESTLLMELIERRANLILLQGACVLDAAQRVGPEMNRYRTVLPGQPYSPPPPQQKLDPTDVTELQLGQMLGESLADQPIWKTLVRGVAGVSPLLAREVVFRATGDSRAPVKSCDCIAPLLDAFLELLIHYWEHDWEPEVALAPDGSVAAFAPYRLTHRGQAEPAEGISAALERFYQPLLGSGAYQAAKSPLERAVQAARQRIGRKRDALMRQAPDPEYLEDLKRKGELILTYASTIARGQTELHAQYELEGPPLIIELDPRLSPVANAQAYFRDYEKAKRAAAEAPARLALAEQEMAYLDQLALDLKLASSWPEIDEVREALAAAGFLQGPAPARPRGSRSQPLRVVSQDGLPILVGRNSRQNEIVTFERAASQDLWLHARGVAGAHVIIQSGGRPVPDRTLEQAARLAAGYSAARDEVDAPVDVTSRSRVRRIRGAKARPGMVSYSGEHTLRVRPERLTP